MYVLCITSNSTMRRLQLVLNAGARLTFQLRRSDHITDALVSLHWLRMPERIQYKITVLTYEVLHDTAPCTVPWTTRPSSRSARSAGIPLCQLQLPGSASMFRLSTVGSRTFNVSGPDLGSGIDCLKTLFRRRLKPFLFQQLYPDIII